MAKVVRFKHEDTLKDGTQLGPVDFIEESDLTPDPTGNPEDVLFGGPYVHPCLCSDPVGEIGVDCANCGKPILRRWVTRDEAAALASEHGLELLEE